MNGTNGSVGAEAPIIESAGSVLVSGLVVIVFGLGAVMTAIGIGWLGAAALGVALLIVAWKVPTSVSARVLRVLIAGFGLLALFGAIFDLFT